MAIALCFVITVIMPLSANADLVVKNGAYTDNDLPKGYVDGYVYGVFDTFNSYASENGLGGTCVWLEGKISGVQEYKMDGALDSYISVITDLSGNNWLILLDVAGMSKKETYEALIGHKICICGQYQGFSDVMKMPAIAVGKYYDFDAKKAGYSNVYWATCLTQADIKVLEKTLGQKNSSTPSTTNTSNTTTTQNTKTYGNTVYITEYGSRYHYSQECAGKKSWAVDINNVGGRTPCKKCAL